MVVNSRMHEPAISTAVDVQIKTGPCNEKQKSYSFSRDGTGANSKSRLLLENQIKRVSIERYAFQCYIEHKYICTMTSYTHNYVMVLQLLESFSLQSLQCKLE